MFKSFFPSPKLFVWSAIGWFFVALAIWHGGAEGLTQFSLLQGVPELAEGAREPFLNPGKVWLYQYILGTVIVFCIAWAFIDRNRWYWWSVCGSALIVTVTYFQVQVGVWLNAWYGEFYDLIQTALSEPGTVEATQFYVQLSSILYVLIPNITIAVLFGFFTKHYVFRWRTAMNDYYMSHWSELRTVEGASQRVQEDTMRFALIVESLGSAFIASVMTLLAFLPLLWTLSQQVTALPILGEVEGSLVFVALISSIFGTVLLAAIGWRLPGLEFNNQKVEAAYRKELVFGEDNADRAEPPAIQELFSDVRRNYFKLYFNYLYFDIFKWAYLQGANIVPLIALVPSFAAGAFTFGVFQQIMQAFNRVEGSFQFLVSAWSTIVELISIVKRLSAFESRISVNGEPAPAEPALQV